MAFTPKTRSSRKQRLGERSVGVDRPSRRAPALSRPRGFRDAGNQALQRWLRQPKPPAPDAGDPALERAARQAAIQMTGARSAEKTDRSRHSNAPPPAGGSGGAPLSPRQRDYFEPRLGHDLGRVRLHQDGEADALSRQFQARAFTVGQDVFFRGDAPRSPDPSLDSLLAHELAHVRQQRLEGTVRLQRNGDGDGPTVEEPFPAPGTLSNEQLAAAACHTRNWLDQHAMVELEYFPRRDYLEQLTAELDARIRAGDVFLAEAVEACSTGFPVFAITPLAEDMGGVAETERWSASGTPPAVCVSDGQLEAGLHEFDIPRIRDEAGGLGVLAARAHMEAAHTALAEPFARPRNPNTLNTQFLGDVSETVYHARTPGAESRVDLNVARSWRQPLPGNPAALSQPRTGAHPAWDFEAPGEATSIKASTRAQAGRFSYYDSGYAVVSGLETAPAGARPTPFEQAVFNRPSGGLAWPPNPPAGLTPAQQAAWTQASQQAIYEGRLAINADDVVAYRQSRIARIMENPSQFRALIDAFLIRGNGMGTAYTSLADIQSSTATQAAANEALEPIVRRIVQTQVVSNAGVTEGYAGLQRARRSWGLDPPGTPMSQVRPDIRVAGEEYLAVAEHGYMGASGRAAMRAGPRGGVMVMAIGIPATYLETGELPTLEQTLVMGGTGTLGTAVGAAGQTAVTARLVQAGAGRVGPSGIRALRGAGSAWGFGLTSATIELGTMGYYDITDPTYNPSGADYFARGGRAFLVGSASGALLTGGLLAFGISNPVGWAALGVILLGIGLYMLIDWLIGDQIERGLRGMVE